MERIDAFSSEMKSRKERLRNRVTAFARNFISDVLMGRCHFCHRNKAGTEFFHGDNVHGEEEDGAGVRICEAVSSHPLMTSWLENEPLVKEANAPEEDGLIVPSLFVTCHIQRDGSLRHLTLACRLQNRHYFKTIPDALTKVAWEMATRRERAVTLPPIGLIINDGKQDFDEQQLKDWYDSQVARNGPAEKLFIVK